MAEQIILKKVRVHNLKGVDLTLNRGELIVFTGVSGSGKSSLAFDTIYVEGQRRYIESLSAQSRKQLDEMSRPDAELITGISPTIAVEQKTVGKNPRSTIGTLTGIYDFLRVLYARCATPHCPVSGEAVSAQSELQIMNAIASLPQGTRVILLAPHTRGKKGELKDELTDLMRKGFSRLRLDGEIVDLSEEIELSPDVSHDIDYVIDRIIIDPKERSRLSEGVKLALTLGKGVMSVWNLDKEEMLLFSQTAYSPKSGLSYAPLEPFDFSFNHPQGMCPTCEGLGISWDFDLDKLIDPNKSIAEDCCEIAGSYATVKWGNIYDNLAELYHFSVDTPWKDLPKNAQEIFLRGSKRKWIRMRFTHPTKGFTWYDSVQWKGVIHEAKKRLSEAKSETYRKRMEESMREAVCSECQGARIKPYPAAAQFQGKTIHELTHFSLGDLALFLDGATADAISTPLLQELRRRTHFLLAIGLEYLSLERTAPSLSGGEGQRVRLASHIASGLVGSTYILDEPSIGLHPRDNSRLIDSLLKLRDGGNTVIVVEHDEEMIFAADTVVDVGPGAGSAGGEIIAVCSPQELLSVSNSATADYLSGRKQVAMKRKPRKRSGELLLKNASYNNLKNVTVKIPLGVLTAVTGVSGSGKSSLILESLYPALLSRSGLEGIDQIDKVIGIDQTPIGRTPRSNPATYVKLFDDIRDLFASLPESEARGYKVGRFSFNVAEGSCPNCGGLGQVKIDMDFLEDLWKECPDCEGRRFDKKTLEITFKGKPIDAILKMTIEEAAEFFQAIPAIHHKLDILLAVGLGYIQLGQSSTTLSGGEAQRIKLAKELIRPPTGRTIYIFDEPTTGLHFADIAKLIEILHRLVDSGNTILVIEHNIDLIKTADWIIDLGPEAGAHGGEIVGEGTPAQIAKKTTPTGLALSHPLRRSHPHTPLPEATHITVKKASHNNLRDVSAAIPLKEMTICCGPSGSGKSSFAFETIYAEGQRRFVETLSPYARQFVAQMPKARVEDISHLPAAIAIEQRHHGHNPRSTLGTMSEIYDYLRLVFAHAAIPYCPETGEKIESITPHFICNQLPEGKLHLLAPINLKNAPSFESLVEEISKQGFLRIRLNGAYFEIDEPIPFDKSRKNKLEVVIDRLLYKKTDQSRLLEAIETASKMGKGTLIAATENADLFFNLAFAVPSTGKSYPPLTPSSFSYNAEEGMCPSCNGLGFQLSADLRFEKEITAYTPSELFLELGKEEVYRANFEDFIAICLEGEIDPDEPIDTLSEQKQELLFNGPIQTTRKGVILTFLGFHEWLARMGRMAKSDTKRFLLPLLEPQTCSSCSGERLKPLSRAAKLQGKTMGEITSMPLERLLPFINQLNLSHAMEEPLLQMKRRLHLLLELGLGYLSLFRAAPTLSGGETQRVSLAKQLGSGLSGSLYVLDEPTIGLHPHDTGKLIHALKELKQLGNTLLLVEHEPELLQEADHLIEFGPGAGTEGGEIIARGTVEELKENPDSLTGAYLAGKRPPLPKKRRKGTGCISIRGASKHNLCGVDVDIPLKALVCITGVSGSGKSTLMRHVLKPELALYLKTRKGGLPGFEQIDEFISIDQQPLGQTSRSDVSTYINLFTSLRTFFASLPGAQIRGLEPKHFSFNHKRGMCLSCFGLGYKTIQLHYLPSVRITCDSCNGDRLNPVSCTVTYQGRNLGQVLRLTVKQALEFLPPIGKIQRLLELLEQVGLGYLAIGQPIATLSGGEAQRLRLARELGRRPKGSCFYLFDEPTIGLHPVDIERLIPLFHALVNKGHTVALIEHNLDLIRQADWVADLGPGAGEAGGKLVASGTPEQIAASPLSLTGQYLLKNR